MSEKGQGEKPAEEKLPEATSPEATSAGERSAEARDAGERSAEEKGREGASAPATTAPAPTPDRPQGYVDEFDPGGDFIPKDREARRDDVRNLGSGSAVGISCMVVVLLLVMAFWVVRGWLMG